MERIQRKALNLQSYLNGCDFNERGLIADTAALATEIGTDRPIEERIHQTLEAVVDGIVINFPVDKKKNVLEMFEDDSPESVAGGKIVTDVLLNAEEGTIFSWFSPPGGIYDYDEGRIRVGIVRKRLGFKVLESYGIPTNFDAQVYLNMFYKLQEFSVERGQTPETPDDLRGKIIFFKPPIESKRRTDWLDFLGTGDALPELKTAFEKIKSGEVGEFNRKAKRESREEVQKVLPRIKKSEVYMSERDAIKIGALIENGMMKRGWSMISKACGLLNSDLLSQQNGLLISVGLKDGKISLNLEQWTWKPGVCRPAPEGCGQYKQEVGPCKICKDCQRDKYDK